MISGHTVAVKAISSRFAAPIGYGSYVVAVNDCYRMNAVGLVNYAAFDGGYAAVGKGILGVCAAYFVGNRYGVFRIGYTRGSY